MADLDKTASDASKMIMDLVLEHWWKAALLIIIVVFLAVKG